MASIFIMSVVSVVILALILLVLKAQFGNGNSKIEGKFKARPLLTTNELEFLTRLEAAAPELRFFPQVAMGALLNPAVPRTDSKAYYRLRGMFSQKIVDFVAQRRSDGAIVAIIELDDRTHQTSKDAKRDEMLQSAGYRIVRWHSKNKPDAASIRTELIAAPHNARGQAAVSVLTRSGHSAHSTDSSAVSN